MIHVASCPRCRRLILAFYAGKGLAPVTLIPTRHDRLEIELYLGKKAAKSQGFEPRRPGEIGVIHACPSPVEGGAP